MIVRKRDWMGSELVKGAVCAGLVLIAVASLATQIGTDQRDVIERKFPGVTIGEIRHSPVAGWYEVWLNGEPMYVSTDTRYLLNGRLLEIDTKRDLTRAARGRARAAALATLDERDMIIYSPATPRHQVTVFTDVSCAHCQQIQRDMEELNRLGVRVRLLALPRHGRDTDAWRAMETVWCSTDRKAALGSVMKRDVSKTASEGSRESKSDKAAESCQPNLVAQQYELAQRLHIAGTPTIIAPSGEILGGYLPPEELVRRLTESTTRVEAAP